MQTADFLMAIRADIIAGLKEELLTELQPEIERRVYANVFDIKEAALYLKISVSTLRSMVKKEEVPYFRQREQIFFRQQDLDKHIDNLVRSKRGINH